MLANPLTAMIVSVIVQMLPLILIPILLKGILDNIPVLGNFARNAMNRTNGMAQKWAKDDASHFGRKRAAYMAGEKNIFGRKNLTGDPTAGERWRSYRKMREGQLEGSNKVGEERYKRRMANADPNGTASPLSLDAWTAQNANRAHAKSVLATDQTSESEEKMKAHDNAQRADRSTPLGATAYAKQIHTDTSGKHVSDFERQMKAERADETSTLGGIASDKRVFDTLGAKSDAKFTARTRQLEADRTTRVGRATQAKNIYDAKAGKYQAALGAIEDNERATVGSTLNTIARDTQVHKDTSEAAGVKLQGQFSQQRADSSTPLGRIADQKQEFTAIKDRADAQLGARQGRVKADETTRVGRIAADQVAYDDSASRFAVKFESQQDAKRKNQGTILGQIAHDKQQYVDSSATSKAQLEAQFDTRRSNKNDVLGQLAYDKEVATDTSKTQRQNLASQFAVQRDDKTTDLGKLDAQNREYKDIQARYDENSELKWEEARVGNSKDTDYTDALKNAGIDTKALATRTAERAAIARATQTAKGAQSVAYAETLNPSNEDGFNQNILDLAAGSVNPNGAVVAQAYGRHAIERGTKELVDAAITLGGNNSEAAFTAGVRVNKTNGSLEYYDAATGTQVAGNKEVLKRLINGKVVDAKDASGNRIKPEDVDTLSDAQVQTYLENFNSASQQSLRYVQDYGNTPFGAQAIVTNLATNAQLDSLSLQSTFDNIQFPPGTTQEEKIYELAEFVTRANDEARRVGLDFLSKNTVNSRGELEVGGMKGGIGGFEFKDGKIAFSGIVGQVMDEKGIGGYSKYLMGDPQTGQAAAMTAIAQMFDNPTAFDQTLQTLNPKIMNQIVDTYSKISDHDQAYWDAIDLADPTVDQQTKDLKQMRDAILGQFGIANLPPTDLVDKQLQQRRANLINRVPNEYLRDPITGLPVVEFKIPDRGEQASGGPDGGNNSADVD